MNGKRARQLRNIAKAQTEEGLPEKAYVEKTGEGYQNGVTYRYNYTVLGKCWRNVYQNLKVKYDEYTKT